MSVKLISYHLVSQSIAALCSCRWPAPCPALASVAIMTINSGKPVPSPFASMSVAIGMSVLRRTVHTPSPTWLLSRTICVVSSCKSWRFSCTTSSCSESFGGVAVMRVSQDCRREGSTQASWAKEPHRHNRLGFGLFSAVHRKHHCEVQENWQSFMQQIFMLCLYSFLYDRSYQMLQIQTEHHRKIMCGQVYLVGIKTFKA